ncbi:MAG: hypothetical protein AB1656_13625 [Candidatus Omnitrophota bacterium]
MKANSMTWEHTPCQVGTQSMSERKKSGMDEITTQSGVAAFGNEYSISLVSQSRPFALKEKSIGRGGEPIDGNGHPIGQAWPRLNYSDAGDETPPIEKFCRFLLWTIKGQICPLIGTPITTMRNIRQFCRYHCPLRFI